jgi:CDP-diacylglycerol--glycerol-3-phosphate 3-phosphatidyltransferase
LYISGALLVLLESSVKTRVPNVLTLSRILMVPIFIASFYIDTRWATWLGAAIFLFASFTDFLDGYLARYWKTQSKFGRFLDPVADKLIIVSALIMLIHNRGIDGLDVLPALSIVGREILISGLREFLANIDVDLPVNKLGKAKTAIQMLAICLLIVSTKGSGFFMLGTVARATLWIAAFFALFSGYIYLRMGLKCANILQESSK